MAQETQNAKAIFSGALDRETPEDRAAYLDAVCGDDQALRARVEGLLRAYARAGDFLQTTPFDPNTVLHEAPLTEGPGTLIDRYKLLEKIGEGGMAVVYMAEQQEPIRRKVALKIIKLGMDTQQVIARFEAERQALALMDHTSIAKVFDGGATEAGRPFFVMELVRGIPITRYCDENHLGTRERLALFGQVCQAVQHAHQKGIIHRDIKPSNVLVTKQDGQAIPKVIDFGIAKAIDQRLTEKTLFTRYAQIIGTPAYMSPEQAEFGDSDTDTRTDIYSLGVLLYELLTGATPFSEEKLHKAGYLEMQRVIREEEPTKPSTKLSTLGATLAEVAQRREVTPDALRKLIRGDLDWIVMKSLEKDRTRRYDTTTQLLGDIERHLRHEPVLAGPPSMWYRVKKFLQRHGKLVATLVAVATALVLGFVVSTSLFEIQAKMDRRLSTVQRLYAEGRYQAALEEIETKLLHQTRDAQVRLLHAQVLYNVGRTGEAEKELGELIDDDPQIAGAAHYLLARINLGVDTAKADEHREQAESLAPHTAYGYTLRALTAATPDEALPWLHQALQVDPAHYGARKARALVHYSRRDYANMRHDVEALIVMRPKDSLGYGLRALALREMGELDRALSDHTKAIELCETETELSVLHDQRQETYWRMGDYRAALYDAQRCVDLAPEIPLYRAMLAKILFKLGQYEQAGQEFARLQKEGGDSYWLAAMSRYISDAVSTEEPLTIPDDIMETWASFWVPPSCFVPTVADLFRTLHPRASRLVRGAFDVSSWSPDGRKLAYTRSEFCRWDDNALHGPGMQRGIDILDLESGRTRTLVTSGGNPTWSPDGRFIAYVRTANYAYRSGEEIWLVPVAGGAPRRLDRGRCPSWTNHPTRLYFLSHSEQALCFLDVNDPTASPTRVFPWQGANLQISPDARYLACFTAGRLTVQELSSGQDIADWVIPGIAMHASVRWSPDSREISLGIGWIFDWPSGLWIFDVERRQGRHVLDPMALSCNWSPDRSRLALDLAYPVNEIWLAEVDPNLPTWEALSTGETRGEYLRRTWHQHVQSYQRFRSANNWRLVRSMCALGMSQYGWGEYEDALWTLQHVAELPQTPATVAAIQTTAYTAITLARLGRTQEAQGMLAELRGLCAQGTVPDETCLYEAEKLFAVPESTVVSIWEHIQQDRLNQALTLLEQVKAELPQGMSARMPRIQSASSALARAFFRSGRAARHQAQGPDQEMARYEAALRADPNYVPALRDLAFMLAVRSDPDSRDGTKALGYAEKACELTRYEDVNCLASLAAAFAECDDFKEAVKWQQEALEHLPARWSDHELSARLKRYESTQHVHGARINPLVAWWRFVAADRDGVQDASGNGLHGRLVGDAKIVVDPERGHVLKLDGLGDYVDCAASTRFNLVHEITVSAWIKVNVFDKSWQVILGGAGYSLARSQMTEQLHFGVHGPYKYKSNELNALMGSKPVDDGQWHHITGVYDGTMMYQYVDGDLDDVAKAAGQITIGDKLFLIGGCPPTTTGRSFDWNGWIDDVRIYNYALSAAEVEALYVGQGPQIEKWRD